MHEGAFSYNFFQEFWRRLRCNPSAILALWILSLIAFFALFGPLFSSYTYTEIHLELKNSPPCARFWFGTDELGRDLFTRVWWGARISLFIGITAAIIDVILGVLWASVAAYAGGKIEEFLMRICDILYSIPYLLVVIFLTVIRGSGLLTILIAMTITGWINMARIVRAQILQLKENDYIFSGESYRGIACQNYFPPLDSKCPRPHYRHDDADRADCDFYRSVSQLSGAWHPSARCELGRDGERRLERDALLSLEAFFSSCDDHIDHALLQFAR